MKDSSFPHRVRLEQLPLLPGLAWKVGMAQQESHDMRGMQGETTQTNPTSPKGSNATHEPIAASRVTSMTAYKPVIRHLRTSLWPLIVFAAYAALTLFTWVVFCLASTRLVGTKQDYMHNRVYRKESIPLVTKHTNFIRAAQIVQAVTALLTIPIVSSTGNGTWVNRVLYCATGTEFYISAG
jgi:hypothetical protein